MVEGVLLDESVVADFVLDTGGCVIVNAIAAVGDLNAVVIVPKADAIVVM